MLHCEQSIESNNRTLYNVLIIEDAKFVNNSVKSILESKNHKCSQAFDYKKASKLLKNNSYDFIILDLNLPDADGEELVENITKLSNNAKIIILTAETDIQARESLFQYGILD